MLKRGTVPDVPTPMRASEEIIELCRQRIDSLPKKIIRKFLNNVLKNKNKLREMGEGFQLDLKTSVPAGSRLGKYAYIGSGFSAPSPITVGDLCMISTNVTIVDNDHGIDRVDLPTRLDFQWSHKVTNFEGDVWVGHGAIIRSGVRLGRGSVIASGAIVTKDVEPYSVVGGNPARILRKRFSEEQIVQHDLLVYGSTDT